MLDPKDYPLRPDHPDWWRLSELVLQLDAQATEDGRRLDNITAGIIDPESLGYLALQRAMRYLGITTRAEVAEHMTTIARMGAWYHEAFILGARFEAAQRSAATCATEDST